MIFLQPNWILAFVCAFVFFGSGKKDWAMKDSKDRSMLLAGISIAISAAVIHLFGAGWMLVLLSQAVLFVSIAIVGALRDR